MVELTIHSRCIDSKVPPSRQGLSNLHCVHFMPTFERINIPVFSRRFRTDFFDSTNLSSRVNKNTNYLLSTANSMYFEKFLSKTIIIKIKNIHNLECNNYKLHSSSHSILTNSHVCNIHIVWN